jgi:uncharacterized protein
MAPKKISAKELVSDIKTEMSDQNLMSKYDLSPQGLQKLFQQLLDKGLINESELARREEVVLNVDIIDESSAPVASRPDRNHSEISSSETDAFKLLVQEAAYGNQEKVQELFNNVQAFLHRGADVNTKSDDGYTALMLAAGWGRSDLVRLLPQSGADVNAENNLGMTPLMNASLWGHKEVVSVLLDGGADVRVQSKEGWTAIRLASSKKHHEIVKLLRSRGAKDVQARPLSDISPHYLKVFQRMEKEDRTRLPNIYALVFSIFWVFFKGMWKKGLVYFGATIVIDMLCELITGHNLGLIIAGIVLCFIGNWDYYLYKIHGESFFNQSWRDGIRSGSFLKANSDLTKVVVPIPGDGMVTQIPVQVEKHDRKIGIILGILSLMFLIPIIFS